MSELIKKTSQKNINIYKFIWNSIRGNRISFFMFAFLEFANDIIGIFIAQYFNKKMVGYLSIESPILTTGLFYVLIYACLTNITFITKSIIFRPKFKALNYARKNVRNYLFNYTIKHPMAYFNNSFSGALNSKINSAVDNVENILDHIAQFFSLTAILIIAPILYAEINIYIGLSFIAISILYLISLTKFRKKVKEASADEAEAKSKYLGLINDDFTNIKNIKSFSNERKELNRIKLQNNEILRASANFLKYRAYFDVINFAFNFILFFSVLGISAYLLARRNITIADFMYIVIIASIFRFVINNFCRKIADFSVARGELENSLNTILKPLNVQNRENSRDIGNVTGKISFKSVIFTYKKGENI